MNIIQQGDEEEKLESRNDKNGGLADDNTRAGQPMADLVTEMGCKKSTLQDFVSISRKHHNLLNTKEYKPNVKGSI